MGLLRPLILGPQISRFYSGLGPNKFFQLKGFNLVGLEGAFLKGLWYLGLYWQLYLRHSNKWHGGHQTITGGRNSSHNCPLKMSFSKMSGGLQNLSHT